MSPSGSSRWCPTSEQLMMLEEMYRSGIRTPNASQIQHITAHLSNYGKIEGKNVFYWFQNHKARDRQKMRRKLAKQLLLQQQQQLHHQHILHQSQTIHGSHGSYNHLIAANNYFDTLHSPASSSASASASTSAFHHQLSNINSSSAAPPYNFLPHQGCGADEDDNRNAPKQMMNYMWKVDNIIPDKSTLDEMMDKTSKMRMNGSDWMMMMMMMMGGHVGPAHLPPPPPPELSSSSTKRPPLKTLQLFPVTASNLKEQFNPSN